MEASDQHDMSYLIELYKAAKYNELIVLLKDLLDKDENNTKARSLIAASYMALGKRTEAIQNLLKLIELEPNSANHHYNLGIAYGSIGNKTLARKSFESALELDPDNQKAKHQLSLLSSKPNNDIALSGMPIGNPQSSHTAAPESIEPAAPSPNPVNNVSAPPPETYMPTYQNPAEGYVRLLGSSKANVPGGLNWGGFFIPFIWSLGHKAWLLALISFFFSPFAALYLLFKGNEIAWLEGDYSTHEDFRRIERVWAICGAFVFFIFIFIPGVNVIIKTNRMLNQPSMLQTNPNTKDNKASSQIPQLDSAFILPNSELISTNYSSDTNGIKYEYLYKTAGTVEQTKQAYKNIFSEKSLNAIELNDAMSTVFMIAGNNSITTVTLNTAMPNQTNVQINILSMNLKK